ncbi:MAG: annexin, partial [Kofleriaceae bacterium]
MFDFLTSATSFFTGATETPASKPAAPPANMSVVPPLVCDPADGPMSTPLAPAPVAAKPTEAAPAGDKAEKPVDQEAMSKAASQIFAATDGWGTNEDAIHDALRGKNPREIAAIKAEYQNHYGVSLDSVLADELDADSEDMKAVQAAMSGDPVAAAAAQLVVATTGQWGTNEEAVMQTLRDLPPEIRDQVAKEFESRSGGQSLNTVLGDELSGGDKEAALALAKGDVDAADAALLDDAMNGGFLGINNLNTDEEAINKVLEGRSVEDRQKLLDAYKARPGGKDLQADLTKNLDSGTEADLSAALLDGKKAEAAAIRIQIASDGLGTDEEAIFKQLAVKNPKDRQAIIDSFNTKYGKEWGGSLEKMLDDELGKADPADPTGDNNLDRERASQLVKGGQLDPVFAMRYAMKGAGTDEDMLKETLAQMDPAQADALQKQYAHIYGTSLEGDMKEELSGRDGHYIMQDLGGGRGLSLEEKMRRADANYDFERGSGAGWGKKALDWMSEKAEFTAGAQLDKQHGRLGELREQMANAKTPEEKALAEAQVKQMLGYQESDVEAFHAAQDSVTNAAATAGAAALTVAVTAATGGLGAAPAAALMMGTAAGGLGSMGVKHALMGDSYGREAAGVDLAMTAVNTATAGLMATGPMVNGLPQMLASNGIGTFAPGVGGSLVNTMATQVVQGGVGGI